ncbi:MAG TPA: calcium/sodium antiporter, partial [Planctomycetota bacterium]|nr:calcium/sodium antiporter [Planctomycetota bacterium]
LALRFVSNPPVLLDVLFLLAGLALLLGGGELLVRGATALARSFGISPLVVGLTVVAFGTSAPELAVNLAAALRGEGGISFGNIVGSNIANVGLIVGTAALVRPLSVHVTVILREIPMMLLASAAVLVMSFQSRLEGGADAFRRSDGLILLLLFGVFLYYTTLDALLQRGSAAIAHEVEDLAEEGLAAGRGRSLLLTVLGLAGLIAGGELTVRSAVALALALGISQAVIGLTIIAVGTSLPELVTSVMAVRRGQSDLAMGNVVGSNIFNLLLVLGLTATVHPIPVPEGGHVDLLMMTAFAVALLPLSVRRRRMPRWSGALLLASYALYLLWRSVASGPA